MKQNFAPFSYLCCFLDFPLKATNYRCLSPALCFSLSVPISLCLTDCLFACLSIILSPSLCFCLCLSLYLSFLSFCLTVSVSLSVSVCLSLSSALPLFICPHLSHLLPPPPPLSLSLSLSLFHSLRLSKRSNNKEPFSHEQYKMPCKFCQSVIAQRNIITPMLQNVDQTAFT